MGKARMLGARSLGYPEPGAVSAYLILSLLAEYLAKVGTPSGVWEGKSNHRRVTDASIDSSRCLEYFAEGKSDILATAQLHDATV